MTFLLLFSHLCFHLNLHRYQSPYCFCCFVSGKVICHDLFGQRNCFSSEDGKSRRRVQQRMRPYSWGAPLFLQPLRQFIKRALTVCGHSVRAVHRGLDSASLNATNIMQGLMLLGGGSVQRRRYHVFRVNMSSKESSNSSIRCFGNIKFEQTWR